MARGDLGDFLLRLSSQIQQQTAANADAQYRRMQMKVAQNQLDEVVRKAKMDEWTREALANLKPYSEFSRPTQAVEGNEDVPDMGSMVTERTMLTLPEQYRNMASIYQKSGQDEKAFKYHKEAGDLEKEARKENEPKYHSGSYGLVETVQGKEPRVVVKPPEKPERPTNVPAWLDAMGVAKWGSKYHSLEGQKEFADYLSTPEGNREAEEFQKQYTKRNSPPTVVQTDKGFRLVEKEGSSSQVTEEGGKPVYRVTPSEVKTSHVALNDNIKSVEGVWEAYNKGLVGPVTGRAKQLGSKFFADQEITTLKRRAAQLRTVIYGLSGKQINESEQTWLKEEILPELIQPSENFEVALKEFDSWVKRRKGLLEQEYPALSGVGTSPPQQQPSSSSGKVILSKDGNSVTKDGQTYPIVNGKVTINGVSFNVKPKKVTP